MDFFEHQEEARKKTHVLVFYFVLAVLGIIAALYGVALIYLAVGGEIRQGQFWEPTWFTGISVGTLVVIGLATAFKVSQLSGGGKVVAQELGGRQLDPSTTDFHERRLLNVVEEMAIASGVPVPDVYVLDGEESINAFAAGKTTSDAVIGVTRGCMKLLTRGELQGVIAHEFSHILNGDMRLNIRLMGLLFGILFLALIGEFILRGMAYGRVRSNSKEGGGLILAILLFGLAMFLIGYVGLFFANLIKASVSRQREFLADASAVQFTRNPEGLADALKKVGGYSAGSKVKHPMARDASHLFFGSAFRRSMFATHPPLAERIRRLVPSWNGELAPSQLAPVTRESEPPRRRDRPSRPAGVMPPPLPGMMLAESEESQVHMNGEEAFESMRQLHPEQVELGHQIHENLPEEWVDLVHSQSGASAMVFALLIAQDEELRNAEFSRLRNSVDATTYETVAGLHSQVRPLHSAVKLGLVELALPGLRRFSPGEYQQFRNLLQELIESDRQVDLFEFSLLRMVNRHLDTYYGFASHPRMKYRDIRQLSDEASILLSTLAAMSHPGDDGAARDAFASAKASLQSALGETLRVLPPEQCGLQQIGEAVDRFAESTPLVKKQFFEACSKAVMTDGAISSREAELIRAIADTMGCAIPPFVKAAPLV